MTDRPYTPESLAERWSVSDRTIRRWCAKGELGFKLGDKLWRIPAEEVARVEAGALCLTAASEGTRESVEPLSFAPQDIDFAIRVERIIDKLKT